MFRTALYLWYFNLLLQPPRYIFYFDILPHQLTIKMVELMLENTAHQPSTQHIKFLTLEIIELNPDLEGSFY